MTVATMAPTPQQQAEAIIKEIRGKLTSSTANLLKIGELLCTFKAKKFYSVYNFSNIHDWLEHSDIGIPPSVGAKLMQIYQRSDNLGISPAEFSHIGVNRLSLIFGLNPKKYAEHIPSLLAEAQFLSVTEVKQRVDSIRGTTPMASYWLRFMVSKEVFRSIEDIQRENGLPVFDALKTYFARQADGVPETVSTSAV